jgi:E3 ubiquitin-protein ligase HUWE1
VNEVEVVFETIKFLTRPAVRVTSQKSLKSTFASINGVLQTLSDRWVSGTTSFDIVECYRAAQQTPAVTFQFYPSLDDEKPGDRKPSIDFNSPVVISQEPSGTTEGDAFLLWKQIVTDYQVPESHSFELLHKSRWCTLFSNVELRRKLLCIRLFSISILTNLNNEEATSKKIFLFEPDLILKLSQLLLLDYVECPDVQFAALNLLDSFCHYRGKLNEVMASIGASANHGYLISMLRKIIDTFEKNGTLC